MNRTQRFSRFAAALVLTAAATASNAALTTYTSAAALAADTIAAATDSFDDVALDEFASPITRSVGGYGYVASATGSLFGAGIAPDVWLGPKDSGAPLVLSSFTGGVRAVGAFIFGVDDLGDFLPGQMFTVTVTDSLGASSTSTLSDATTSSFLGFVSTGFISSLTIQISGSETYGAINDLVLAGSPTAPVPEPATYGMLLAGLTAVAFLRRRRNN